MPLWSNEEWRARIGSSWCVLGKPIAKNHVHLQEEGLSGQKMLQAAFILILVLMLAVCNGSRVIKKQCLQGQSIAG